MLGLLNLHNSPEIGPLTADRPMATLSFLGRYAIMDFALSNFVNSEIDQIGIMIANHQRSVNKHLGSRNTFNVNTKTGFEALMYNEDAQGGNARYNHEFGNIRNNFYIFEKTNADYIVFAPAHFITTIDYRDVLKAHIESEAEITLVYAEVDNAKSHYIGSSIVSINDDGRVVGFTENKGADDEAKISLEIYIINRDKLMEMMTKAAKISSFFGLHDYISYTCNRREYVHSYKYEGYLCTIDSGENYVKSSLDLLNYRERKLLFKPDWPIYTVTHDTPPAQYSEKADVQNAFVANGSYIEGQVINSIISRNVSIGEGVHIENSIIFSGAKIGKNVTLKNAIVDKRAVVTKTKVLIGEPESPVYIGQGDQV